MGYGNSLSKTVQRSSTVKTRTPEQSLVVVRVNGHNCGRGYNPRSKPSI